MTVAERDLATSAPDDAALRRAAARFCGEMLPRVSRTFTLSIRVLPGTLGRAVRAAYLLCRIADTIEDEPSWSPEEKAARFGALAAAFDDPAAIAGVIAGPGATGDPAHAELVARADLVFVEYRALPAPSRGHLRHWIGEMIDGMRKFVLLYPKGIRIQTLEEYREYCYYVAGTVGYLLTDLWFEHSRAIGRAAYERLRERCRAFAEGLQTVNILKDVARDVEFENSIYVPDELLRAEGSSHASLLRPEHLRGNESAVRQLIDLARASLDDARTYVLLLPRRAVSIRLFCILPLLYAHATLRDLAGSSANLRPGETVKISRREVKSLLMTGTLLVASNRGIRWLIDRVRLRAFAPVG